MLFGELKAGEKFIFPCAVNDGRHESRHTAIYIKLEYPVSEVFEVEGRLIYAEEDMRGCRTAISMENGSLMSVPDDAEVIVVW